MIAYTCVRVSQAACLKRMGETVKDSSTVSHEILMARFQQHLDINAFQRIVAAYSRPALAVAQRILSDGFLAEDAVQETFLRVFRRRGQFQVTKPFSCWFYTILRNVCTDMLRQRSRHAQAVSQMADWPRTTVQPPGSTLDVQDALQMLPVSEQTVLTFRILHGLPFRDIAALMGISPEAAKKRAQRGLRKLRERVNAPQSPDTRSVVRLAGEPPLNSPENPVPEQVPRS